MRLLFVAWMMLACGACSRTVPSTNESVTGPCPKCRVPVTGHLTFWDGHDQAGRPICGAEYTADCGACGAHLDALTPAEPVTWQVVTVVAP